MAWDETTKGTNNILSQSFINNNLSKIDATIKTDSLVKTNEDDKIFRQIFKLSNEIFMDANEIEKIFNKHEAKTTED